ncbi:hypothetical protein [Wolbachia endosymbiont of Ctenocephalides felis wCfeJ]|uniref:hypothetical protein n=1 Tax=Wolbachia endosymbiont of Ctenocephalides felis wCfeJ TaxID=2732594 RepID=UPI001447B2EB|nr:hypothetical protein [Wolbachia endosymbiont of Ctenocephalides felis wCfeJ]WCR58369.1 MAG: hypothetical protein PG980_000841 [Wolbachia endosymbiont of Ctenocephalides felis wCfeJ]
MNENNNVSSNPSTDPLLAWVDDNCQVVKALPESNIEVYNGSCNPLDYLTPEQQTACDRYNDLKHHRDYVFNYLSAVDNSDKTHCLNALNDELVRLHHACPNLLILDDPIINI